MKVLAVALLLVIVGSCQATVKEASALCMRGNTAKMYKFPACTSSTTPLDYTRSSGMCMLDEQTGLYKMYFYLDMNTEPMGVLYNLNYENYTRNFRIFTPVQTCISSYSNSAHRVEVIFDDRGRIRDASGNVYDNDCDIVMIRGQGQDPDLYKAVFLQTQYNNDLIEGNDRVYEVTCDENSFLSNTVYAHVTVLTPDLMQTPTMRALDVIMEILVDYDSDGDGTGDGYVTRPSAAAGIKAKIRVSLNRTDTDVAGILPFFTFIGPDQYFGDNEDLLIGSTSCPYDGDALERKHALNTVAPDIARAEYQSSQDGVWFQMTTGWFYLPHYDGSDYFWAMSYYKILYVDQLGQATVVCPARRRKRSDQGDLEDDKQRILKTSIRVVYEKNPDRKTADSSSDKQLAIIVGAVSGAAIVMLIAGAVCIVAILRNNRKTPKSAESSRASSTASIVHTRA